VSAAGSADELRDEVRAWLHDNWHDERPLLEWRGLLADAGWGCPTWPTRWWGRGLRPGLGAVVEEEIARFGAVGAAPGQGVTLAGATILEHGSDEVKARFLRQAQTGEHRWCQLFSEPGSGSDLAGLTARAELDGDEWVITGQKVWNTSAHKATYGMLLARTNFDVPKHRGITYFLIDMRQPGVEVRPLMAMNRYASFNEVFLTEARVPVNNVVGAIGEGWRPASTTLASERFLPSTRRMGSTDGNRTGRCHDEARDEANDYFATYKWYPQRAGRADLAVPHAQRVGLANDPVTRQRLADLYALTMTAKWTSLRARAAKVAGKPAGAEGSVGKLVGSEISRRAAALHAHLAGAHGMLSGPGAGFDGVIAEILVSQPGQSIAGGTDEIQRNIIGERTLGLPREPAVDIDVPFRDVRTNMRAQ
jgi:alkylation response protein AidB-like acyl-CoA dehydrogenase